MLIDLAIWEGVKAFHENNEVLPFSLCVSNKGLIIQNTAKEIQSRVHEKYSDNDYNYITSAPGSSAFNETGIKNRIEKIKYFSGSLVGMDVLEIGGGNDYMASLIEKNEGCDHYTVVDPSIRETSKNANISIVRDYFEKDLFTKKFDRVICISCLEHVPDAVVFLNDIFQVLKSADSNAVLFFPIVDAQFESGDINSIVHEHISYFTKESAKHIIESIGLKIDKSEFNNDGGWFLLSKNKAKDYDVKALIDSQNRLLDKFEVKLKSNIGNFVSYVKDNDNLVFFCACNGVNSLLEMCDLNNKNIVIVDSDQSKKSKYISALHSPIFLKDEFDFKPDQKLVVASNSFYEQISQDLIENYNINKDQILSVVDL